MLRLPHFILYSRAYCHLCDEMHQELKQHFSSFNFTLALIDIDADPSLLAQYDELVPVLLGVHAGKPPRRLCHYFLDHGAVRAFLSD
jgi:predicted ribosome-associated RNA-binding protein Tma20